MSSPDLSSNLSTLKDAVAQFLKSVLGKDVPVDLDRPAPAAEALKTASSIRILHPAVLSPDWYVFVEDAWVPLLSGAMIGEAMMPDQDGADDLLREVATQAFAAVRRALEEKNVVMPEFEMSVQPTTEVAPALSNHAAGVQLRAEVDGQTVSAWIVVRDASSILQAQSDSRPHVAEDVAVSPAGFPDLGPESINSGDGAIPNFELMAEVQLEVSVELGRRSIPLADLLRLTTGSVIELEKLVGEPLEVYANGRLIAEGEAVVIDEQFGIRITRLASVKQRARAFS